MTPSEMGGQCARICERKGREKIDKIRACMKGR